MLFRSYDVVLMDVQMPQMDGLEASRRITSQWQAHERPRIIAMTANAMQGDREMCMDAGMDDYLTKPIRVERLVEALHAVPQRGSLPVLERYARLEWQGESRLVASVEASRGCKHLCRHCPVVPVYNGTFRVVPADVVLADIRQQVESGAQHITFGDPDFFNGPAHGIDRKSVV